MKEKELKEDKIVRIAISLPKGLYDVFERYIKNKQYANRSEAIRDLIRNKLVEEEWRESEEEVMGVITYLYDHHSRDLTDKLLDIQHEFYQKIITTQHVHVSHDRCLEVVLAKGKAKEIKALADRIQVLKGVLHLNLSIATLGKKF